LADAALPKADVEIFNMRTDPAADVLAGVLGEPATAPEEDNA